MGEKYCVCHLSSDPPLTPERVEVWLLAAFNLATLGAPLCLMEQESENCRSVEYSASALRDSLKRSSIVSVYPLKDSSDAGGVQFFSAGSVDVAEVFLPSTPAVSAEVTVALHAMSRSQIGAFLTVAGVELSVPSNLTRESALNWAFDEAEVVCTSDPVRDVSDHWASSVEGNTTVFRRTSW
jgi:hypothetical protein